MESCSGEAMLLWGVNLLWGGTLGRQCCFGEVSGARGMVMLLGGGNVALGS
ncbi:MAG: hypothetical protein KBC30_01650 [Planctomycetes bacterium]|nr:hypothetical protein [Planctomycetota bacterium]